MTKYNKMPISLGGKKKGKRKQRIDPCFMIAKQNIKTSIKTSIIINYVLCDSCSYLM